MGEPQSTMDGGGHRVPMILVAAPLSLPLKKVPGFQALGVQPLRSGAASRTGVVGISMKGTSEGVVWVSVRVLVRVWAWGGQGNGEDVSASDGAASLRG